MALGFGAEVPRGLLGVDDGDAGDGLAVGEIGAVLLGPEKEVFDFREPALVVEGSGEFAAPRNHAVGDGFEGPDADFGVGGDAVFPAMAVFDADAEEADAGLGAAEEAAVFAGGFADEPGGGETAAALAVGGEEGDATAEVDGIDVGEGAAAVGDGGGLGIDGADGRVPEVDEAHEALAAPGFPGPVRGILGVGGAGQVEAGSGAEVLDAVDAVADAFAVPTVVKEAVGAVAGHDFLVNRGHELEVVGAVGAGEPHVGHGPVGTGMAFGVDGDPVGMGGFGIVPGGVGIGADEHGHAELAAAGNEIAEAVAIAEPGAAMVEGNLGGVVGDAASAADAGALGAGALKVVEPEMGVVVDGIVFDQRELEPAHGPGGPVGNRGWRGRDGFWPEGGWSDGSKGGAGAGGGGGLEELAAGEGRGRHAGIVAGRRRGAPRWSPTLAAKTKTRRG